VRTTLLFPPFFVFGAPSYGNHVARKKIGPQIKWEKKTVWGEGPSPPIRVGGALPLRSPAKPVVGRRTRRSTEPCFYSPSSTLSRTLGKPYLFACSPAKPVLEKFFPRSGVLFFDGCFGRCDECYDDRRSSLGPQGGPSAFACAPENRRGRDPPPLS